MKVEVVCLDKPAAKFQAQVRRDARQLETLLKAKGDVEVFIVGARRMKALNSRFRKKESSTNVLSFPKPKDFPGDTLGEVYLDPLYIEKKKEDLSLMLVHGILHILGYDHKKQRDRLVMEKKERALLRSL